MIYILRFSCCKGSNKMRYLQEKRFAKMRKGHFANFCEENNEKYFGFFSFFRIFAT